MDPICHTLVGAALAEAGLKHRTRHAVPTLLVAANLPDVDILAYVWSPVSALAFRRGWTHGMLALVVLPVVLAGVVTVCDRLGARWSRRRGPPLLGTAPPLELLMVSFLGVLTHPVLDFLNTYGVRWLMPLTGRWYYGDTLFIVDPFVWLVLGAGVVLTRKKARRETRDERRVSREPAALALALVSAYVVVMGGATFLARRAVTRQLAAAGVSFDRLMVAPAPANPFRKQVLVQRDGAYRLGTFRLWPRREVAWRERPLPTRADHPAALEASQTPEGRKFLVWARFPYYLIRETGMGYEVR
ncbi:MAG: metal-dependent hydrolase, partial [Gemmatimonadetes bacterium]|nr:metal-dependent hydrolase [Gemmatimonadota bacterium]